MTMFFENDFYNSYDYYVVSLPLLNLNLTLEFEFKKRKNKGLHPLQSEVP